MSDVWAKVEGHVVNGVIPLQRFIGGSEQSGVFLSESAMRDPSQIAVKLVPAIPHVAEAQLSRWITASSLKHPHLIRIFEAGRCQLGEQHFVYAIMEYADQNLAQLLEHRALTEDEAREMLAPTLQALTFLHGKKLEHGRLKPSNILVVGDQLKIASDMIRPVSEATDSVKVVSAYEPPEAWNGNHSTASDIWALGVTLSEALTQRRPAGLHEGGRGVVLPPDFPQAAREIVAWCLSRKAEDRPKAIHLEAWVRGQPTGPVPAASPEKTASEQASPPAAVTPANAVPATTAPLANAAPSGTMAPARGAQAATLAKAASSGTVAPAMAAPSATAALEKAVLANAVPAAAATLAKADSSGTVAPARAAPAATAALAKAVPEKAVPAAAVTPARVASAAGVAREKAAPAAAVPERAGHSPQAPAPREVASEHTYPQRSSSWRALPLTLGVVGAVAVIWASMAIVKKNPATSAPAVEAARAAEVETPAPVLTSSEAAPEVSSRPQALPVSQTSRPSQLSQASQASRAPSGGSADVEGFDSASSSGITEVLPDVPRRASQTIRGHVKVSVRVIIDQDGTVFAALSDHPGPSRYFERLAIDAAKKWTFPPAESDAQRLMLLKFDFTRDGTTARAATVQ